jgi:hypothetical protein
MHIDGVKVNAWLSHMSLLRCAGLPFINTVPLPCNAFSPHVVESPTPTAVNPFMYTVLLLLAYGGLV